MNLLLLKNLTKNLKMLRKKDMIDIFSRVQNYGFLFLRKKAEILKTL